MKKGIFITATDTGAGKTLVSAVLGLILQRKGLKVGYLKPVQCAGNDATFVKNLLKLDDDITVINPYYLKEPLSPHLALRRARKKFDFRRVKESFCKLSEKYDLVIVEGAGGLMAPIREGYFVADLIKDLGLEVVIVARKGLGTINHTTLTLKQAEEYGLKISGLIFNSTHCSSTGIAQKTNPKEIQRINKTKVLGILPYFRVRKYDEIVKKVEDSLDLKAMLSDSECENTKALESLDKKHLWHPFTQMKDWAKEEPLIIEKGEGNYLIDTEGKRYLDGVSSLWVNVHGHCKKEINDAIKKQLNKLEHSTLLGLSNVPAIKLSKKLVEVAPKGLNKVFYSDSGSTAVEVALKIAYQYWQNIGENKKTQIVHLANSYHGDTLGSVSVGGIDLFHKVYRGLIFKTIKVDFPDCYRAPKGKKYPAYAFECVRNIERLFSKDSKKIAAFIVEPIVQGAAGMIVWPKGILKEIERICRKNNVLLIADEVATGFGRTGKMFTCEHENVRPDIMCLAKGLTGGYLPLAATLTTDEIYNGFLFDYKEQKTFFHGHTYTGNPLACTAALANIEVFEKEKTLNHMQPKIKYLEKRLKEFLPLKHVGDVRNKGFMVGIELVKDKKTKEPFPWEAKVGVKVCREARLYGVILRPLGNVIVLMPPLNISIKEINCLISAVLRVVRELY